MISRSEVEYDLTGLTQLVSALDGALLGNHQDGDIHRVLKVEAGQLAWEISQGLGPESAEEGGDKAERSMKRFLTAKPAFSNLEEGQQYSSTSDFTWLEAGPSFLVGINDEDNQVNAGADNAMVFLRGSQKAGSRGKAYVELGQRGKQHIYHLNRTRVSQSAFNSVLRSIRARFGILRASFAYAASRLIPNKRVPQWISRHFSTQAGGRAIFNESGLASDMAPFLEFGSTAPGVESNPDIVGVIRDRIEGRKVILRSKIQKVFAGYAYDWNNGRVFRRREASEVNE